MNIKEAIYQRRSLRVLDSIIITDEDLKEIAEAITLAPSCFNNQPWRYVFIREKSILKEVEKCLSKGNSWANNCSMIAAVFTEISLDCRLPEREYFLFDTGLSVSFLLLRSEEMGIASHVIAGYDENFVKRVLNIPEEMKVICLIIFGKRPDKLPLDLSQEQLKSEIERPVRKPYTEWLYLDKYNK